MARKNLLKGFKKPKGITYTPLETNPNYGKFTAYPFETGFGTTIGNTLRRVLLSSIQGYAVTSVRITSYDAEGVPHVISSEFEAIPNIAEDTLEVINSLKQMRLRLPGDTEQDTILYEFKGPGTVKSDDFAKEWHQMLLEDPYFTMNRWMQAMGAANQQAIITAAESDEIARKLSLKSSQGGYKICIIWLPERMNPASANKLLKLVEEPPQQTVFILVSEAPEQLLETIRSRTQRIELRKIDTPSLEQALVERRGIDGEVAHRLARTANGNWNKALEELDAGNENVQFLDMFIMLMRLAYTRNIHDLKKWSEVVATFGREKQKRMLVYFMRMVRENFMFNFRQPELNYMTKAEENFSTKFARFINEANVIDIAGLMDRAVRDISQNANAKIVFFDMALKMIVLLIRK